MADSLHNSGSSRLLITGASGPLGQLIVKHLLDSLKVDSSRIVAGSRSPDKLSEFEARGVETRLFDFNDPASMESAGQGIDRALIISGNDLESRLDGHKAAVTALVGTGVKHILFTSAHNIDNSIWVLKHDTVATETFIRESKVPGYTLLRHGMYFENDFYTIAAAKKSGQWLSAAKDGKLAAIARADLALADATALASDNEENTVYELSGTVGLTTAEIVANINKVLGTSIQVVDMTEEQLVQAIAAATGMPVAHAVAFANLHTNVASGLAGPGPADFKKLTGRDPQSHGEWLESVKEVLLSL